MEWHEKAAKKGDSKVMFSCRAVLSSRRSIEPSNRPTDFDDPPLLKMLRFHGALCGLCIFGAVELMISGPPDSNIRLRRR